MKTRYYWDKKMECVVEIRDGMNSDGPTVLSRPMGCIGDIDNYAAVGIQDPNGPRGAPLVITGGRRQHRDELKARGLVEVGTERLGPYEAPPPPPAGAHVREALAKAGYYDGARSFREMRRQGR